MHWRTCLVATPLIVSSLVGLSGSAWAQAPSTGVTPATPAVSSPTPASSSETAPAPNTAAAVPGPMAPAVSAPQGTQLTWLGHAAWLLRSPMGTTVLVDPWLDNPKAPKGFVLPEHIDAIVVTHGHADHVGEAVALAEKLQAPVVASFELIEALGLKDGIGANPGGTVTIKDIDIHLTQAVHSSSVAMPHLPPPPPQALGSWQNRGAEEGEQGDHSPCTCPDHSQCAEHHHHDPEMSASGHDEDSKADHAGKRSSHNGHHHKRKHNKNGRNKNRGEAQELVLGGDSADEHKADDSTMGPAEKAVTEGAALAAKANEAVPGDNAALTKGSCHCGPEAGPGAHGHHPGKPHLHYAGAAMGVIFKVAMGPTIFHAGDTDVFLDMGLIKRRYEPEVALLPIGGHYTMGPKDAALAASLLGAHDIVPMHYGTSPQLAGTPEELKKALEDDQRMVAPSPGATISYGERH